MVFTLHLYPFGKINKSELDNYKSKFSNNEFKKVADYGNYITGRFANLIIKNLKAISGDGKNFEYIDMVNKLFELNIKDENKSH